MGLKINLENATFMFRTVRGEGEIAKCIPGPREINPAPSQGVLSVASLSRPSDWHHTGCLATFPALLLFAHLCIFFLPVGRKTEQKQCGH